MLVEFLRPDFRVFAVDKALLDPAARVVLAAVGAVPESASGSGFRRAFEDMFA